MATWAAPLADLRTFLADTTNDNLVKDQKLFGETNGQNRTFFTFEDRLVASGNQSVCGTPIRVFCNAGGGYTEIAASGVLVTDSLRGELQLMYVPSGSVSLKASYHYQQFLDAELNVYLQQAANQVTADTASNIALGLQASALHIAASFAYKRLAQRWQQRKSEQFLLQDEPARTEAADRIEFYRKQGQDMMTEGIALRRSYYDMRLDTGRSPAYGVLNRTPSPYTPVR